MKFWNCVLVLLIFTAKAHAIGYDCVSVQTRDDLGRVVKYNRNICRVISFAPSITEIIFSLEAHDKLVGVTKYSDYPVKAKELPIVGSYVHLDLEKIVALQPDICFAIKDGNPMEIINRLETLGIPVYIVNPTDLNSVLSTVINIGILLDAKIKAISLVDFLNDRINRVRMIVSKAKCAPGVFFQLGVFPIISAGNGTFIDDLIKMVHGINVMENVESYPRLSREDVVKLAPDVIILTAMKDNDVLYMEKIQWETWQEIPAVSNNNIFIENANLFDRPSPRLVDGLELLAMRVHPELFEDFYEVSE